MPTSGQSPWLARALKSLIQGVVGFVVVIALLAVVFIVLDRLMGWLM